MQRWSTISSPIRDRAPRPSLLSLGIGAILVIVGATASGLAAFVSAESSTTLLNATVGADAATVRSFADLYLLRSDVAPGGLSADREAVLQHGLHLLVDRGGILNAALLAPDGSVLAGDDAASAGQRAPQTPGLVNALQNQQADAAIVPSDAAGALTTFATGSVLREYLPIVENGRVNAVVAIWRDAAPILAQLGDLRFTIVLTTLIAALVSAVLMALIFLAAQRRLARETLQQLEAARRDPLTGALNHGALVRSLHEQVDVARSTGGAIGVALLDLDRFGLLDDTYGHAAGDHVLVVMARLLAVGMPPSTTCGRYGPDEFLIIAPNTTAAELEPAIDLLRTTLSGLSIQFESSEGLPVTFSAGICSYPANGESVTTLLSMTALTLEEAKASGGAAIRVAEAGLPTLGHARTFNVLEGLVIAVDTKDRYTRRHSEDVARYADLLGSELGLDGETRQAIHRAALLHDIGKIGIPDAILRKAGPLTGEEDAIVEQHVRLGESIVRDLPDIDLIREGIRHHHERWDGRGYLTGLAAGEIPLVARILAVGDAFSAMTTTHPHRTPVPVEEGLHRLEDAAGSQLDAHLVDVFVRAIRSAPDAPMPGGAAPDSVTQSPVVPDREVG